MNREKTAAMLLILGTLFTLFNCNGNRTETTGFLKEEAAIFEKNIGAIQHKYKQLKDAEKNNHLQNQLDLKRELSGLILGINNDLKICAEKQNSNRALPFMQDGNSNCFEVKELRLAGCRFNEEIMDAQIQLVAVAMAKESKNNSLTALLLNGSDEFLKEIKFYMTNDFPEKGKIVRLYTHIEGINELRNFMKIKFN